jgi:hypothetical protein
MSASKNSRPGLERSAQKSLPGLGSGSRKSITDLGILQAHEFGPLGEEISMIRRLSLLLFLIVLGSDRAQAQLAGNKLEVFGGYSYMRLRTSPAANFNGWELAGQYSFNNWLGGVADVDGHYGKLAGVSSTVHTFLFGPQVSWPARVSPFAHVLFGGAHLGGGSFSSTSFSAAIGAGIDARIARSIYWRIIQGDYLPTHFVGSTQTNARVTTGIVFRF